MRHKQHEAQMKNRCFFSVVCLHTTEEKVSILLLSGFVACVLLSHKSCDSSVIIVPALHSAPSVCALVLFFVFSCKIFEILKHLGLTESFLSSPLRTIEQVQ